MTAKTLNEHRDKKKEVVHIKFECEMKKRTTASISVSSRLKWRSLWYCDGKSIYISRVEMAPNNALIQRIIIVLM